MTLNIHMVYIKAAMVDPIYKFVVDNFFYLNLFEVSNIYSNKFFILIFNFKQSRTVNTTTTGCNA